MPVVGGYQVFDISHARRRTPKSGCVNLDSQIISRQAKMPPGFSTRFSSARTVCMSGMCMSTLCPCTTSEAVVLEGQGGYISDVEDGGFPQIMRRDLPLNVYLRLFHVHAMESPGRDRPCQPDRDCTGSASEVQDALSTPEVREARNSHLVVRIATLVKWRLIYTLIKLKHSASATKLSAGCQMASLSSVEFPFRWFCSVTPPDSCSLPPQGHAWQE